MPNYSIGRFSKQIGVTTQTLRNWHKRGFLIPAFVSEGGTRYYSEDQLQQALGAKGAKQSARVVGYCRVPKHKENQLEQRVELLRTYLIGLTRPFEILTDVGSGVDYAADGLTQLIRRVCRGEVEKIVVLDKRSLPSVGYELIESVVQCYGCSIEIIDNSDEPWDEELVQDLQQIIERLAGRMKTDKQRRLTGLMKALK